MRLTYPITNGQQTIKPHVTVLQALLLAWHTDPAVVALLTARRNS